MAALQLAQQWVTVYLTGSRDWDSWLPVAKTYAQSLKIWEYINPDVEEPPSLLTKPSTPSVSQIKAGATVITNLMKITQLTQYSYLREIWKKENKKYEKIEQGLTLFHNHLHFIIDMNRIVYLTKNDDFLHSIIKALKAEYSMSIETR